MKKSKDFFRFVPISRAFVTLLHSKGTKIAQGWRLRLPAQQLTTMSKLKALWSTVTCPPSAMLWRTGRRFDAWLTCRPARPRRAPDVLRADPGLFCVRVKPPPSGAACQSPNRLWCPLDRTQIREPFLHHFLHFAQNHPLQINHLRRKLHHRVLECGDLSPLWLLADLSASEGASSVRLCASRSFSVLRRRQVACRKRRRVAALQSWRSKSSGLSCLSSTVKIQLPSVLLRSSVVKSSRMRRTQGMWNFSRLRVLEGGAMNSHVRRSPA